MQKPTSESNKEKVSTEVAEQSLVQVTELVAESALKTSSKRKRKGFRFDRNRCN